MGKNPTKWKLFSRFASYQMVFFLLLPFFWGLFMEYSYFSSIKVSADQGTLFKNKETLEEESPKKPTDQQENKEDGNH